MDVGVRELKQNLSAYLERAARGETIRVTDRGLPKAILGPVPGAVRLDRGLAEGWIAAPTSRARAGHVRRARAAVRTDDVLAEDRGE
ncbi:type II toxin-antitoxin system prevent-host-death family antitoxin [Candidatus Binatia bacterium]|nr:type II toxin-antitoxin system prevent-host-death family antitoxin [Candidatus Binatia bacterium]